MEWINDNPYTCPLLMLFQGWVKWQKWHYGCDGWVLIQSPTARARCMWPSWIVLFEHRLWQSFVGIRIRKWCGSQQREYRLKQQQIGVKIETDVQRLVHCFKEGRIVGIRGEGEIVVAAGFAKWKVRLAVD